MKLIERLEEIGPEAQRGALSIGNFDGVHWGHADIARQVVQRAREVQGPAVILTFDPHPVRILRPDQAPAPLTWTRRKAELLAALGIDVLVAYPTDSRLLDLSAEDFFRGIALDRFQARAIVEGPNFRFGKNRQGDVSLLRQLCQEADVCLDIVPPRMLGDDLISSSRVRRAIQDGNLGLARNMLTEPYRLRGLVVHGAQRGKALGFPTANLDGVDTLIPAPGVYAGTGRIAGESLPAAIHVGPVPTFGEKLSRVEVHLIDFHRSIYGETLEVDFLQRLRDVRSFPDVAALKQQLCLDVEQARTVTRG